MPIFRARRQIEAIQWFKNGDHPLDGVGKPRVDPVTGGTYPAIEGGLVRFYRDPDHPGEAVHDVCGRTWHDHGWIDSARGAPGGWTVCPGDWLITTEDTLWGNTAIVMPDAVFQANFEEVS